MLIKLVLIIVYLFNKKVDSRSFLFQKKYLIETVDTVNESFNTSESSVKGLHDYSQSSNEFSGISVGESGKLPAEPIVKATKSLNTTETAEKDTHYFSESSGELLVELSGELSQELSGELVEKLSGELSEEIIGELAEELSGELATELSEKQAEELSGELAEELSGEVPGDSLDYQFSSKVNATKSHNTTETTEKDRQYFSESYDESLVELSGELSEELSGELVESLSGELSEEITGELAEELSGELATELSEEQAEELSGELAEELSGEVPGDSLDYQFSSIRVDGIEGNFENIGGDVRFSPQSPSGPSEAFIKKIEEMNPGSKLVEGDMILDNNQQKLFGSSSSNIDYAANQARIGTQWPNNKLYYAFQNDVNEAFRNDIRMAVKHLGKKLQGCITFEEGANVNQVLVSSNPTGQCIADVGVRRTGKKNTLNLDESWCSNMGVIQHEFLHALGIYHQQSRYDRDQHLTIKWENIATHPKNMTSNFKKQEMADTFHLPYDYSSIMHYGKNAFSKKREWPKLVTIETKNPANQDKIGRQSLSQQDIRQLKLFYGCEKSRRFGRRSEQPNTGGVSCGKHRAADCSHCGGSSSCNGDCIWNLNQCIKPGPGDVSCGGHRATECSKCGEAPLCNGDCIWNINQCIKAGNDNNNNNNININNKNVNNNNNNRNNGCLCKDYMGINGHGNCVKFSQMFGDNICYVDPTSTCTDKQPSLSEPGLFKSAEACRSRG